MGLREILEYQATEELGIEASTPSRWVPVEFVAVKTFGVIKGGVEIVEKAVDLSISIVGVIKGGVNIGKSSSGQVYESPASTD